MSEEAVDVMGLKDKILGFLDKKLAREQTYFLLKSLLQEVEDACLDEYEVMEEGEIEAEDLAGEEESDSEPEKEEELVVPVPSKEVAAQRGRPKSVVSNVTGMIARPKIMPKRPHIPSADKQPRKVEDDEDDE